MIRHQRSDGSWPWNRIKRVAEPSDGNDNLVAGETAVKESLMILLMDSGIPGRGIEKLYLIQSGLFVNSG